MGVQQIFLAGVRTHLCYDISLGIRITDHSTNTTAINTLFLVSAFIDVRALLSSPFEPPLARLDPIAATSCVRARFRS
ncbi:hypothetical protein L484_003196 [Morus notabilis]|uniref:Uncharacterized protein n=1 Tax=Morus notabilis TaxID=981085 RepID=W9QJ16_9ROSA|nr:hypothetical protein L484_003196 [Morus notabilis]